MGPEAGRVKLTSVDVHRKFPSVFLFWAADMPHFEAVTSSSTSSNLLTLVRQRDAEAWERFACLYAPLVYGWCRRAGISSADADALLKRYERDFPEHVRRK